MNTISNSENFFARHFVFPYRSSHQRCSIKQMFLRISQNSQESTCARASFLIKLKKRLWHSCFSVNFGKFLWTSFLQNTSGRLLLYLIFKFKKSLLLCSLLLSIQAVRHSGCWGDNSTPIFCLIIMKTML